MVNQVIFGKGKQKIFCASGRFNLNPTLKPSTGELVITGDQFPGSKFPSVFDNTTKNQVTFKDEETSITLKGIYVDRVEPVAADPDLIESLGNDRRIFNVYIKDRRWRFKWAGDINLRANLVSKGSEGDAFLDTDTLTIEGTGTSYDGSTAELKNLVGMLLEKMGEAYAKKGASPGLVFPKKLSGGFVPDIRWEFKPCVQALDELFKDWGLIPTFNPFTDQIEVYREGEFIAPVGLPGNKFRMERSLGSKEKERPGRLVLIGGRDIHQVTVTGPTDPTTIPAPAKIGWEPVAMNSLGNIIPLSDFSVSLGKGSTSARKTDLSFADSDYLRKAVWSPNPFDDLPEEDRKLAKDWVYKAFRLPGAEPGGIHRNKLPMLKELVEGVITDYRTGPSGSLEEVRSSKKRPLAQGYYARKRHVRKRGATKTTEPAIQVTDPATVAAAAGSFGDFAAEPPWGYRFLFEHGVVIFNQPMGLPRFADKPLDHKDNYLAIDYVQVTFAYEIKDEDKALPVATPPIPSVRDTQPFLIVTRSISGDFALEKIIRKPNLRRKFSDGGIVTLREVEIEAEKILVESAKQFVQKQVQEYHFAGAHNIRLNGLVKSWSIECPDGPSVLSTKVRLSDPIGFGSEISQVEGLRMAEGFTKAKEAITRLDGLAEQVRRGDSDFASEDADIVRSPAEHSTIEGVRVVNVNHFGAIPLIGPAAGEDGEDEDEDFCFCSIESTTEDPHQHDIVKFNKGLRIHYFDEDDGSEEESGYIWAGYLRIKIISKSGSGASALYDVKEVVGSVTSGPLITGVPLDFTLLGLKAIAGVFNTLVDSLKVSSFEGAPPTKPAKITEAEALELDVGDEAFLGFDKDGGKFLISTTDMRFTSPF